MKKLLLLGITLLMGYTACSMSSDVITKVGQEEGRVIVVPKNTDVKQTIYTDGLRCCVATIVYLQDIRGNESVIMTHYSPSEVEGNISQLMKLICQAKFELSAIKSSYAVIVQPGDFQKHWFSREETLAPSVSSQWISSLKETIASHLSNPPCYMHTYHASSYHGTSVEFSIDPTLKPSCYYHVKNSCYFPEQELRA